jgi:LacI family transcriptional regulator
VHLNKDTNDQHFVLLHLRIPHCRRHFTPWIRDHLRVNPHIKDIFRIIHGMTRPTIPDLAKAAGVSIATVNRVIGGAAKVRPETLQRVIEAAQAIGFHGVGALRQRSQEAVPRHRFGVIVQTPHRAFGDAVERGLQAAAAEAQADVQIRVEQVVDLAPEAMAARMLALGETADALAVTAAEHPIVTEAIDRLAARGVPVLALVSPLSARSSVGFVGLDGWKVGRMSAWAFDHLCRAPGPLGILVGTHRYRCHDQNESGFRSYFREHPGELTLLEPLSTFESDAIAREMTEKLLRKHADLRGLYVSGGGIGGALAALRDSGRAASIITVGYDLMESTRAGLLDGSLSFVISHPFRVLGKETLAALARAKAAGAGAVSASVVLPFEIYTRENL